MTDNTAEDIDRRSEPLVPEGLPRTGAMTGAVVGFIASTLYAACVLLFQLAVRSSGARSPGMLPQTAKWVTYLMVYLVFGTAASVVLGALVGALNGLLQTRSWASQSAGFAWMIGMVIGVAVSLLVGIVLRAKGFQPELAIQLRFLSIPSMIFAASTGLTGVFIRLQGVRKSG